MRSAPWSPATRSLELPAEITSFEEPPFRSPPSFEPPSRRRLSQRGKSLLRTLMSSQGASRLVFRDGPIRLGASA